MIVCPSCFHQNPDGAVQCEACYTKLPVATTCPNCGAAVQSDASFCGQCGFDLKQAVPVLAEPTGEQAVPASEADQQEVPIPDLVLPDPLVTLQPLEVDPIASGVGLPESEVPAKSESEPPVLPPPPTPNPPPPSFSRSNGGNPATQIQQQAARLLHLQTSTLIDIPPNLTVVHLGKPNDRIPPDVDVAGFPNSEVVSRIHADIRIEGDTFFIEDVGSANGTYINNLPLPPGNRHRLRAGDRIGLGKGDLVTFLFQLS
ncbi:MAG: FHA domain-containing protein [Aphanocapsa sp. GSE-SYN-MK-11-07L]|jgi:ribosomal protein L40E|nr:FHA domain-containing protein [Aphanocapsa sp. GSE-SYN-MK-11-07L]